MNLFRPTVILKIKFSFGDIHLLLRLVYFETIHLRLNNLFFQVAKLTGHTYRVLYLATSPDGECIVTGAGDETLRLVQMFIYWVSTDF